MIFLVSIGQMSDEKVLATNKGSLEKVCLWDFTLHLDVQRVLSNETRLLLGFEMTTGEALLSHVFPKFPPLQKTFWFLKSDNQREHSISDYNYQGHQLYSTAASDGLESSRTRGHQSKGRMIVVVVAFLNSSERFAKFARRNVDVKRRKDNYLFTFLFYISRNSQKLFICSSLQREMYPSE